MTLSAATTFFGLELTRAISVLGYTADPRVIVLGPNDGDSRIPQYTVAYVVPSTPQPTVAIFRWALETYDASRLGCVARHEASHLALGHTHGTHSQKERERQEQAVADLMLKVWHQDSGCNLR